MLRVTIPEKCHSEIYYSVHCLLKVFLEIDFEIDFAVTPNVAIHVNEKQLVIANSFFKHNDLDILLSSANIPDNVVDSVIQFNDKKFPIVSVFGDSVLEFKKNQVYLSSDIIASTFFMLTRWEEHAVQVRDEHNRFVHTSALAVKEKFIGRPIVNEYVEFIWEIIKYLGYNGARGERKFKIVPTHDVDVPFKWNSLLSYFRSSISQIKNRRFNELISQTKCVLAGKDAFDTFDMLMTLSEGHNVKSHFFFMSGGATKYDGRYDIKDTRVVKLIDKILDRGHLVGIHPSYDTCEDKEMLEIEIQNLKNVVGEEVGFGRQHYLRFSVPKTWQIWDDLGLKWDSSMTYANVPGFRCGVCYGFPVYDFLKREMLDIQERPTVVMETTLTHYMGREIEESIEICRNLKNEVKKYNGEFVFLWHNSSFNTEETIGYKDLLFELYASE